MKKRIYLLITFMVSLFIFCGRVEARKEAVSGDDGDKVKTTKELTCVYENGIGSYVTMLVQDKDSNLYYYIINTDISNVKDINRADWKKYSDISKNQVMFHFEETDAYDVELGDLDSCPQYTTGYVMNDKDVYFFDKDKEWWKLFQDRRFVVSAELSCEDCLPYVFSGETTKEEEVSDINEADWSSKCVYCSENSSDGCLHLYFNEEEILLDNHRAKINSEKAKFTIKDIKENYGFACPSGIYELYAVSYSEYEVPPTHFFAEYYLVNPSIWGIKYNPAMPLCLNGLCSANYLYELKLNKEQSDDSQEYDGELDSIFDSENIDNCKDLIDEDIRKIINDILNYIKILVPILLVGFGIFDFTKAVFSNSDGDMSKHKKKFFMRIVAAVIVFLVPTLVNLLLTLANEVWAYISPTSCL